MLLLELLTSKSLTHASLQEATAACPAWQHLQDGGGGEKREERKEMGGRRERCTEVSCDNCYASHSCSVFEDHTESFVF
ncbi:hypothetical protein ZWY2020_011606 [Hordeum vulgare]|nr:hypothetical protein ZWY2020_011606 [Hordeum vulgare]